VLYECLQQQERQRQRRHTRSRDKPVRHAVELFGCFYRLSPAVRGWATSAIVSAQGAMAGTKDYLGVAANDAAKKMIRKHNVGGGACHCPAPSRAAGPWPGGLSAARGVTRFSPR
jgi:hypothetical protein